MFIVPTLSKLYLAVTGMTMQVQVESNLEWTVTKIKDKYMTLDGFETSYTEHTVLPRYRLPEVPSIIKVSDNPKLR